MYHYDKNIIVYLLFVHNSHRFMSRYFYYSLITRVEIWKFLIQTVKAFRVNRSMSKQDRKCIWFEKIQMSRFEWFCLDILSVSLWSFVSRLTSERGCSIVKWNHHRFRCSRVLSKLGLFCKRTVAVGIFHLFHFTNIVREKNWK